jgi:hypothetical protein
MARSRLLNTELPLERILGNRKWMGVKGTLETEGGEDYEASCYYLLFALFSRADNNYLLFIRLGDR